MDLQGILDEDVVTEDIAPLLVDRWDKTGEMVSDTPLFVSGTTEVRMENPSSLPITINVQFPTMRR